MTTTRATSRLSTKGQLILPKEVRDRHGWRPGTAFEIEDRGDSVVLRPVSEPPECRLSEIVGSIPYAGPRRSLGEMDRAVAEEARRRR